jgi:hypothetical protein
VSAFRDGVGRLADQTEKQIRALFVRYEQGRMDRDAFVALAAALLATARARGVALADLTLTAGVIRALGEVDAPLGLTPPEEDTERLQTSVSSVLDADVKTAETPEQKSESIANRLGRLGRDSPVEAAVWALSLAATRRNVGGWVRETDRDPCKVCQNLADGVVRPFSVMMKRHTGCACVPQPVL